MTRPPFILLIAFLSACDSSVHSREDGKRRSSAAEAIELKDSVFATYKNCLSEFGSGEVIWSASYPVVADEPSDKEKDINPEKIIARSNDLKNILTLIDSFPKLQYKTDEIELARLSSYSYLYFLCNHDTILNCHWDPGRFQMNIGGKYYKVDFAKLYKLLEELKINRSSR